MYDLECVCVSLCECVWGGVCCNVLRFDTVCRSVVAVGSAQTLVMAHETSCENDSFTSQMCKFEMS